MLLTRLPIAIFVFYKSTMENTMTTSLQAVQEQLVSKGVRDVKFFFSLQAGDVPFAQVKSEATFMLQQYLEGNYTSATDFSEEIVPS